MSFVLRPRSHSLPAGFAQLIAQRFGRGPFLVVGTEREELQRQFAAAEVNASVFASLDELAAVSAQNGVRAGATLAIWFYPRDSAADDRAVAILAGAAESILLVPEPGDDSAARRPELVRRFADAGFLPDYSCDLGALEPGGLRLIRAVPESVQALVPAVESAVARLQRQVSGLERSLRTRMAELEAADHHISTLEEKLLKWKEARKLVKQLKAEKQALRKSPERKLGQVLLAPYLLPKRLVRGIRKRMPKSPTALRGDGATGEYHAWFEKHRSRTSDLAKFREEGRAYGYRPCVSIITPVFNTPRQWLEECVQSVLDQSYEEWELILIDDNSDEPELLKLLPELAKRDSRIVLAKSARRGGISAASNRGLEVARGDWIGFLDHDDLLEPDALFQHLKWLQDHPNVDLIYSDEDKL